MTCTVGSDHLEGTACFDGAVESDDVVVAYHLETSLFVPAIDILHGEVFAFDGGRTVDDDLGYLSHSFVRIPLIRHRRVMRIPPRQMPKHMRDRWSNQVSGRWISLTSVMVTS